MTAPTTRAAVAAMYAAIPASTKCLRELADSAVKQYSLELAGGGEPVYPEWVNAVDILCWSASLYHDQGVLDDARIGLRG